MLEKLDRKILRLAFDAAAEILRAPLESFRLATLDRSIRHVHGPLTSAGSDRTAVVLCVVKDAQNLVEPFIEHYLSLGCKHLFFLDNDSTDRTPDIIKTYQQTTLLISDKPFSRYYIVFKNYLIRKFGCGKWCILADIDEFLHFPIARNLEDILTYLNSRHYNAVAVQMLETFSKDDVKPEADQRSWSLEQLRCVYCYCDLSNIARRKYARGLFSRPHPTLDFLYGGIRRTVFGLNCFLTKEAMFLGCKKTTLKSSHLLKCARVADFSAVFFHYKFTDDFIAYAIAAAAAENHWHKSAEYKMYARVAREQSTLAFWQPSSFELRSTDSAIEHLIEQGFLSVSREFSHFFRSPADRSDNSDLA